MYIHTCMHVDVLPSLFHTVILVLVPRISIPFSHTLGMCVLQIKIALILLQPIWEERWKQY